MCIRDRGEPARLALPSERLLAPGPLGAVLGGPCACRACTSRHVAGRSPGRRQRMRPAPGSDGCPLPPDEASPLRPG
eukprot:953211-Alexandrium_andersonii.AAC.1